MLVSFIIYEEVSSRKNSDDSPPVSLSDEEEGRVAVNPERGVDPLLFNTLPQTADVGLAGHHHHHHTHHDSSHHDFSAHHHD